MTNKEFDELKTVLNYEGIEKAGIDVCGVFENHNLKTFEWILVIAILVDSIEESENKPLLDAAFRVSKIFSNLRKAKEGS